MIEPRNQTHSDDIAGLLTDLSIQLDRVRRAFDHSRTTGTAGSSKADDDVVFIDDLTHCLDCSWSKQGSAEARLAPDVVAQCGQLLESSLHVLRQIERMQMTREIVRPVL